MRGRGQGEKELSLQFTINSAWIGAKWLNKQQPQPRHPNSVIMSGPTITHRAQCPSLQPHSFPTAFSPAPVMQKLGASVPSAASPHQDWQCRDLSSPSVLLSELSPQAKPEQTYPVTMQPQKAAGETQLCQHRDKCVASEGCSTEVMALLEHKAKGLQTALTISMAGGCVELGCFCWARAHPPARWDLETCEDAPPYLRHCLLSSCSL